MRIRRQESIVPKSDDEIELMAASGRVVARALSEMAAAAKPGVTTMELAAIASRVSDEMGAVPSFLGYRGYPSSICASVNEQVIHGIPNSIPLKEGDIVGLDYGAKLDGYHADSALTVAIGDVGETAHRLMKVTREALVQAIHLVKPGVKLGDISHAVQRYCERAGFSVVREMVGHGIGKELHESPEVPNYGEKGSGITLKRGMTFCIEPMINAGRRNIVTLDDGWTIVTQDNNLSAHFEHTVVVTNDGVRILTLRAGETV